MCGAKRFIRYPPQHTNLEVLCWSLGQLLLDVRMVLVSFGAVILSTLPCAVMESLTLDYQSLLAYLEHWWTWSIACSAYQFMRSICVWVLSLTTYRLCSGSRNGNYLFIKSVWSSGRAHCHMSLKAFLYLAYLHCCCWEGSSVPAMRPVLHLDNMEISGQDYTASLSSPISYVWQQPVTL